VGTSYELITYRVADGVATIELNRPAVLNAFSGEMGAEVRAAVAEAREDDAVRAVLLRAAGRAFSAGGDFSKPRPLNAAGEPDLTANLRANFNALILELRGLPKPVVAEVQGACAGFAVGLVLACDLVLTADNAFFLLAFVKLGLSLDGGTSAFVTERIGLARAAELAMLGERLPAERALEWGLVNAVHPLDELPAAAQALAQRLATGPTMAYGKIKYLLSAAAQRGLADQLKLEEVTQQSNASSADYAEASAAFREKRAATFIGR
jgi:2-(1,2-epoxy-1,2-dihydrophenyl)acetyl-CoA isomerase